MSNIFIPIGIVAVALLILGVTFSGIPFATLGEELVFCAEYEWTCCAIAPGTSGGANEVFWYQCPPEADHCTADSIQIHVVGFLTDYYVDAFQLGVAYKADSCQVLTSPLGQNYVSCSGKTKISSGSSVKGGEYISIYGNQYEFYKSNIKVTKYLWKLFECGSSPCALYPTGVPLSQTCSFTGAFDEVYDENNRLVNPDYKGLYTVPNGECYKSTGYANRRVCGTTTDECSSNTDCITKYPYKWTEGFNTWGATCSQNVLTLYGCVNSGQQDCAIIGDINKNNKLDYGETCFGYNDIKWCGAIAGKTIPVQCCPDTTGACGANAVCNPATFRCEETRQCDYNWQCEGAGTYCDASTKKVKTWGCLPNGYCGTTTEKSVECCSDINCAEGWFCDSLGSNPSYECYETPTPIIQCPHECCMTQYNPSDSQYIQKPCPPDEPICCGNHVCAESIEACSAVPPEIAGIAWWMWIVIAVIAVVIIYIVIKIIKWIL